MGADCLETNTFGANRFKLATHGLEGRVREVNRQGARLARDVRETMGRDVFVLGSIGPLGKYLAPIGALTEGDALAAFREQAEGLLEGGVDGFVAETFSDLRELRLAEAERVDVRLLGRNEFGDHPDDCRAFRDAGIDHPQHIDCDHGCGLRQVLPRAEMDRDRAHHLGVDTDVSRSGRPRLWFAVVA